MRFCKFDIGRGECHLFIDMFSYCIVDQGNQFKLFIEIPLIMGLQEAHSHRDCQMRLLLDELRSDFCMDRQDNHPFQR